MIFHGVLLDMSLQPAQNIIIQSDNNQNQGQGQGQKGIGEEDLAYYESRRGQGWEDPNIVKILTEWIHYASVYLDILSEATEGYRKTLRMNTIINLIVSTLASTLSVSTFNTSEMDSPRAALGIKITFTILTFTLTIAAGYIKVYQIQEKLENSLRLKQEWALFGSKISSEMQLPLVLRKNAIFLISTMKGTYLDLVKSDMGIKKDIIRRMAARSGLKEDDLTLSELFERIIKNEIYRIQDNAEESETMTASLEKQLAALAESYGLRPQPLRRNSRSRNTLGISYPPTPAVQPYDGSITPPIIREILPKDTTIVNVEPAKEPEMVNLYKKSSLEAIPVDEVFKAARALKEAEAIKKAIAAVSSASAPNSSSLSNAATASTSASASVSAPNSSSGPISSTKTFLNMFSPNSEDRSKREDNARQLLADRGRISSFLRSPTQIRSSPRKSYVTGAINDQIKEIVAAKRGRERSRLSEQQQIPSSSSSTGTGCQFCGEFLDGMTICRNCNGSNSSAASVHSSAGSISGNVDAEKDEKAYDNEDNASMSSVQHEE